MDYGCRERERERDGLGISPTGTPRKKIFSNTYIQIKSQCGYVYKEKGNFAFSPELERGKQYGQYSSPFLIKESLPEKKLRLIRQKTKLCSFTYVYVCIYAHACMFMFSYMIGKINAANIISVLTLLRTTSLCAHSRQQNK